MAGIQQGRSGRTIYLPPMHSNEDVNFALRTVSNPSPDYIKAVVRAYIDLKRARYKTNNEIHQKLMYLERQFPQYRQYFADVRLEKALPPSQAGMLGRQPGLSRQLTAFENYFSPPAEHPSVRSNNPTPSPRTARAASHSGRMSSPSTTTTVRPTTVRPTTVRPVNTAGDDEELPPPPYTADDPEPDSTRILEQRLAAEAQSTPSIAPVPLVRPDQSPASPVGSTSGTPRVSSQSSRPNNTTGSREEGNSTALTPQRVPSDPELRRIWEESQLDEARRLSVAAERERQEMERAVQLSLAEAEREQISQRDSGPERGGPEELAATSQDWTNAYNSTGDTDAPSSSAEASAMPGSWNDRPSGGAVGPSGPTISLMDEDESDTAHHLDAPMLKPVKTGTPMQSRNPFLSSVEHDEQTGSPSSSARASLDRPATSANGSAPDTVYGYPPLAFPQTPQMQDPSHSSPSSVRDRHVSDVSLRDSPGSSYTSYNPGVGRSSRSGRTLPSPPGPGGIIPGQRISSDSQRPQSQPVYAPPPGPPPPHLRVPTPPAGSDGDHTQKGTSSHDTLLPAFKPTSSSQSVPPLPPRKGAGHVPIQAFDAQEGQHRLGGDPLEALKNYDTVFLINDSASMAGDKWASAQGSIIGVAEIAAEYDDDGIDVYFVNSKRVGRELKNRDDVEDLFAGLVPRGAALFDARLEAILREYMSRLERAARHSPSQEFDDHGKGVKPLHLILVTGEAPSGDPASVIVSTAKRLDRGGYPHSQIRIQFFQIGNDAETRESLQVLDDGLAEEHGIRDMVDIVPYEGPETSAEAIISGLVKAISLS